MLTLCNLRNVYVYERMQLGLREMSTAVNARELMVEWWRAQRPSGMMAAADDAPRTVKRNRCASDRMRIDAKK